MSQLDDRSACRLTKLGIVEELSDPIHGIHGPNGGSPFQHQTFVVEDLREFHGVFQH